MKTVWGCGALTPHVEEYKVGGVKEVEVWGRERWKRRMGKVRAWGRRRSPGASTKAGQRGTWSRLALWLRQVVLSSATTSASQVRQCVIARYFSIYLKSRLRHVHLVTTCSENKFPDWSPVAHSSGNRSAFPTTTMCFLLIHEDDDLFISFSFTVCFCHRADQRCLIDAFSSGNVDPIHTVLVIHSPLANPRFIYQVQDFQQLRRLSFWRINISICVYFKTLPRHSL